MSDGMTCVLSSMASLFTISCPEFTEDGSNLPTNMCGDYDINDWLNDQQPRHENPMCSSLCRIEAITSSSFVQCEMEICNGSDTNFQQDGLCITNPVPESHEKVDSGTSRPISTFTESATDTGVLHQPELLEMCNTTNIPIEDVGKHGVKRKSSTCHVTDKVYLPVKRVSPFLNTPKEKKEERKKILKLTVKKLNLVSDPDRFLRKTVVMHNTMKQIQRELKEEKKLKKRTRKDRSKTSDQVVNGVLANSSMSLFDDLFFNGVLEKIPEDNHDLSNSLINSLNDKLCDTTDGCVTTCSSTNQFAPVEFPSSLPSDSYELKPYLENETTCTHLSRNAISVEHNDQSLQMDSSDKMDIDHCEYQLSNTECPDICFDEVHSAIATTISDRGVTLHDTVPSSSNITADYSNSIDTYRMDSMECELINAISHLEAIASDSSDLDNFDICHSVDYLTAAHSLFSPQIVLDPNHSNNSLILKEVEMCI